MDTVSMLNKMSFYCQPILPLVYDESMSYYETLCKVVGQLNTTGDAVNKLNEGLTDEITGRQEADRRLNERLTSEIDNRHEAERLLNERLKVVEEKTNKIHFLIFAGTPPYSARPVGAMPTRSELRQWINDRDMIVTLLETTDEERNIVYAMSCNYNAVNWTQESPVDFNIIVPISTDYDSERDYAVRQKIAKITIPPDSVSSLDENWGLQFIEINTPSTSADGVVNLVATVSGPDSVNCSITPSEFLSLYNMTRGGKNLCVAVNARLEYDAHVYSSSIATVNPDGRTILITFEKDNGVYTDYGVNQTIRVIHYLIGNAETNTWEHESIRSRIQDFVRYEGFQFTRKSGNVIATENDSTPSAVYSYYKQLNGKFYQNLPACLIDEVDNAEYWNGTFDIKDDRHMTFTFVTSNYVTASGKMLVRVIELSADVNTTTWKYAEKEFELPITVGKIEGNVEITGGLKVGMSAEFSSSIQAQSEITSDLLMMAPVVALHDPATEKTISLGVSGENVAKVTSPVSGGGVQYARLKVASPTEDNDAATKKYVDDHSAGGAITYVDFWPTGSAEQYNGNYDGYQIELATDQTFDTIFDSFKAGNKIVARLYENESKDGSPTSSVDASVTGTKEFGAIKFQFVTANDDTDAIAGFPFIGEAIMMMGVGEGAIIYLIENRNVLPTPNADGTDNGKVPIINGTKWELKTLPTYANGNEVSY